MLQTLLSHVVKVVLVLGSVALGLVWFAGLAAALNEAVLKPIRSRRRAVAASGANGGARRAGTLPRASGALHS